MTVSYDFSTDVAIITGAARGVGRVMVSAFVAAGCQVVAADRDEAGLLETAQPYGTSVRAVTADVSAEDGADAIVDTAVREFGSLSFCINNAAVAPHTSLLEETVRVWDTVFAVNCRGTFLMTQRAARVMIDQGRGGRIINFSSGVTNRGAAGNGAYASSRAATTEPVSAWCRRSSSSRACSSAPVSGSRSAISVLTRAGSGSSR